MRNLKRALSLALAAIMLIGMMVVGASAASYNDLTDKDEIVNKDAVSMLTTLGIIEGKPDGSFAPTEGVDRAQMAKMISVIMNQGADNSALYENSPSGLTDTASHWAKGHINYCFTTGIIAGRGNGKFDPDAGVTGSEAAKMLLVAAGYDPAIEGLTGADWEINTNALASKLGIFRNLTAPVSDPLTRDNAALLIYNALDIEMIEKYENGYAIGFKDYRTILSTMYGVYKLEGVVAGNEWAQLMGTGVDDALANGKTRLEDVVLYDSNTLSTNTGMSGTAQPDTTLNVTTPVEYMGKTVTMYIRKTTVLADSIVLGVVLKDESNVVKVVNSNNETNKDILKGSGLSIDKDTKFYVNYGYQKDQSAALNELGVTGLKDLKAYQNVNGVEMEIIDNDNDGIVDYVLYTKEDLTVVSGVSSSKETTTLTGFNNNKAIDNEDIVTELDLAIDDVVLAITYGGRYYVTEPQVVTGQMEAYSSSKLENQYIEVDGTEYRPSYIGKLNATETSANGVGEIIDFDIELCEKLTGVQFKNTYDFFLDSNGYVRAFRPTEESAPNYALVLNSGYDPGVYSSDASGKLTVLLADGTEGTYAINFSSSASNLGKQLYGSGASKSQGITELKGFMGTDYTDQSDTRPWLAADSNYQFAHKNTTATHYKAGRATGYVICYTMNDENVMTIKYVIGGIGAGKYAVNEDLVNNSQLSAAKVHTLSTTGTETLTQAYGTGEARVHYNNGGAETVAIDKNTVAFYFEDKDSDGVADDGEYGVAVGYDNMANVTNGKQFLASTVVSTTYNSTTKDYEYKSTNLADVIIFDEANIITARDYAYVLSANRTSNDDKVTLNVLFENGEAGTLTVKKSHFDDIFDGDNKFNRAYAYSIDSKDIATLTETTTSMVTGVGYRLKAGTVALSVNSGREQYYAYDKDDAKIWDVTDAKKGEAGVKVADFNTQKWNMILILDTKGNVRTAFVWEYDGSTPGIAGGFDFDWNLSTHGDYVTLYEYDNAKDVYDAFDDGKNVLLRGDYDLANFGSNSLIIPEGRILYVDGDFDADGKAVKGDGTLWVGGDYTDGNAKMAADTQIGGDLILNKNTSISSTVAIVGDVVEPSGTQSYNLTLETGSSFYATDLKLNTLTIYGHMELVSATVVNLADYRNNSLVVTGNLVVSGTMTVGKSGNPGNVTVGGTITGNTVNVAEGNLTMTTDKIDVANVTVAANGTLSAKDVQVSTAVTVSGKATLTGDLTASVTGATVTVDNGSLKADNVTVSGGTVTVKGTATVETADITATTTSVEGDATLEAGKVNGALNAKDNAGVTVDSVTGTVTTTGTDANVVTKDETAGTSVGETLIGTYAGDVTLTATTTVAKETSAVINGALSGISGENTLTVKGTLTLNGAGYDLTNVKGADGAKIIFGADATVTNAGSNLFFYKGGTEAVNAADFAGLTFTYTTDKFVANSSAPVEVKKATLSVEAASYTYGIEEDATPTTVTPGVSGTTITLTVKEGSSKVEFTVKPGDGVEYSVGANGTGAQKNENVFTITKVKEGSMILTATGDGLQSQTYTIKVVFGETGDGSKK